jgi:hypothetical protein
MVQMLDRDQKARWITEVMRVATNNALEARNEWEAEDTRENWEAYVAAVAQESKVILDLNDIVVS